jgi:hypothetical protein
MVDRIDNGRGRVRRRVARAASAGWIAVLILVLAAGACTRGRVSLTTPPTWMNSVVTAHEQVNVTPAMTVAQRLDELRRAKEAAYRQLIREVYALPLSADHTIEASLALRPNLRPAVESYVRRTAVVEPHWQAPKIEVQATVEVGAELLELLEVKQSVRPTDRTAPSTGIVHPLK